MKKLAIISIVGGVLSLALTIGFITIKLNNDNLFKVFESKVVSNYESKKTEEKKIKEIKSENKKVENKKAENKPKTKKIETKVNKVSKIEYTEGKVPDFIGYNQTEVYEFAKEHGIKYELGQAVATPLYKLKGTIAKQSIEPGKNMPKDETLEISIYIFDGHYEPSKEEDPCH